MAGKSLCANLTRKQIEHSPSIASHKPVSRQYEEDYHRYFDWLGYWQEDGPGVIGPPSVRADSHLRSTQAVNGYHLRAGDQIMGHVCDFIIDDNGWEIRKLVIKIGHRFTGKEVEMPVEKVERISYEESTVFVNSTVEAIEQSPGHELSPLVAAN